MNTRSVQLTSGTRRLPKTKNSPQSLLLVLLPMILSVLGGAAGYFFLRGYFSRATEVGVFVGYAIGWAIEASVRVPAETAAQKRADSLHATSTDVALAKPIADGSPARTAADFDPHAPNTLPGHLAAR